MTSSLWMLTGNSLIAAEAGPYQGRHRKPTRRAHFRAWAAAWLRARADHLVPAAAAAAAA